MFGEDWQSHCIASTWGQPDSSSALEGNNPKSCWHREVAPAAMAHGSGLLQYTPLTTSVPWLQALLMHTKKICFHSDYCGKSVCKVLGMGLSPMCDPGQRLTFIMPITCRQVRCPFRRAAKSWDLKLGTLGFEVELTAFGGVT